jgi:hypothetical protein
MHDGRQVWERTSTPAQVALYSVRCRNSRYAIASALRKLRHTTLGKCKLNDDDIGPGERARNPRLVDTQG